MSDDDVYKLCDLAKDFTQAARSWLLDADIPVAVQALVQNLCTIPGVKSEDLIAVYKQHKKAEFFQILEIDDQAKFALAENYMVENGLAVETSDLPPQNYLVMAEMFARAARLHGLTKELKPLVQSAARTPDARALWKDAGMSDFLALCQS
jgi:hypothetical protein